MTIDSSLATLFSGVPDEVKSVLKDGFTRLCELSNDQRGKLIELVKTNTASGRVFRVHAKDISDALRLDENDGRLLSVPLSMLVHTVATRQVTAEALCGAAVQYGVLASANRDVVIGFISQLLSTREQLKSSYEDNSTGIAILPSYDSIDAIVDVRLRFKDQEIDGAVPIVILQISTDISDQFVRLQATAENVDEMIKELEKVKRQLASAGTWSKR